MSDTFVLSIAEASVPVTYLSDSREKTTMEAVAKAANVSRSTVSRVINNDPCIPVVTVQAVREAIERCGYSPRPVQTRQGPRVRIRKPIRHKRIVLLFCGLPSQLHSPVYSRVVHSIEEYLQEDGWNLIVSTHSPERSSGPLPERVDGCILFGAHGVDPDPRLMRELRNLGGTVRIMSSPVAGDLFDHVTYDNSLVGELAARHLLARGHRRIAAVGSIDDPRVNDFCRAVAEGGGETFKISRFGLFLEKGAAQSPNAEVLLEISRQLSEMSPRPDALYVSADILMLGFYHALPKVGMRPGHDIEIVGTNNDAVFLDCLHPRPASVDIHAEAIGRRAVDQLYWRLDHPREPRQIVQLEPELYEGEFGVF
jgi:DNA-binding LacI/PurR family transcriptional regulator